VDCEEWSHFRFVTRSLTNRRSGATYFWPSTETLGYPASIATIRCVGKADVARICL
jgi:hypothetical protein